MTPVTDRAEERLAEATELLATIDRFFGVNHDSGVPPLTLLRSIRLFLKREGRA